MLGSFGGMSGFGRMFDEMQAMSAAMERQMAHEFGGMRLDLDELVRTHDLHPQRCGWSATHELNVTCSARILQHICDQRLHRRLGTQTLATDSGTVNAQVHSIPGTVGPTLAIRVRLLQLPRANLHQARGSSEDSRSFLKVER
jgi:hypothetical protein